MAKSVERVLAVEPDAVSFRFLLYNVSSNGLCDKVLHSNIALRENCGKIFPDRNSYGYGRHKTTTAKTDYTSDMWTLDELVLRRGLGKVNLIKIDTEGFELDVLKGSVTPLRDYKPDLIIAAYHFPEEYLLLSDFLRKQAYSVSCYTIPLFLSNGAEIYLYAQAQNNMCAPMTYALPYTL